jgi:hypothetical protein
VFDTLETEITISFVNNLGLSSDTISSVSVNFIGGLPFNSTSAAGQAVPRGTPLPTALPLFATGLGGLGLLGWRRKRKSRMSLAGAA